MEVRALCIRLMMNVLFLLAAQDEVCCSLKADADFPRVDPNKQQFFEYEKIVVSCEGLMGWTGWRVLKRNKGEMKPCAGTWESSTGPCEMKNAIPSLDTGEYWCEIGANKISSVNITVTAGSVILESPVLPVDEGGNVTLSCRNKQSSPNITAQFFRNGVSMGSSLIGTMTIHNVSRSQEGLYKCSISGAGESPQSWLSVREAQEEDASSPNPVMDSVWICVGICIFLVVLLLLVGCLRLKKHPAVLTGDTAPSVQSPPPTQRAPREARVDDVTRTTYSVTAEPKKKRASEEAWVDDSLQSTYSLIHHPRKKAASAESYLDYSMQSTYAVINKP